MTMFVSRREDPTVRSVGEGSTGGAAASSAADANTGGGFVAVDEVYRRHFIPLTRVAAMVVGDSATAQDVVQDVFVSLHARWSRLSDWSEQRLLGYVRRAVLNGARSVMRRRGVAAAHQVTPHRLADAAEVAALSRMGGEALRREIARLPRRQQEVVLLRYLLDLSSAETAQALDISVTAVASSAARGIAALQDALASGVDE